MNSGIFKGRLDEYRCIAIDCFEGDCLKCDAFFLSHCHSDHMNGLADDNFYSLLLKGSPRRKLYCSLITGDLLTKGNNLKHSLLKPFLHPLPVNEPVTIKVSQRNGNEDENLVVTLLPAGHCPGSVMFLFEGNRGTVLFTGDCRLNTVQLQSMHHLHCGQSVKKIDKLYLDTTFCIPQALELPSRTQTWCRLFAHLDPWLAQGNDHCVYLKCSAQFGYEQLFIELAKRYNMKVHVPVSKYRQYENIDMIREAVTSVKGESRIHACDFESEDSESDQNAAVCNKYPLACLKFGRFPCDAFVAHRRKIMLVTLSVLFFNEHTSIIDEGVYQESSTSLRILYSTHSSFREITELVKYLNPCSIFPLTTPVGTTLDRLMYRLKKCRDLTELRHSFEEDGIAVGSDHSSFGTLQDILKKSQTDSVPLDSQLVLEDYCVSPMKSHPEKSSSVAEEAPDGEGLGVKPDEQTDDGDSNTSSQEWKFVISPIKSDKSSVSQVYAKDEPDNGEQVTNAKNCYVDIENASVGKSFLSVSPERRTSFQAERPSNSDIIGEPVSKRYCCGIDISDSAFQVMDRYLSQLTDSSSFVKNRKSRMAALDNGTEDPGSAPVLSGGLDGATESHLKMMS